MARSRLAITLLGAPRVERNGVPVSFDTRKAIALLAYVAVAGRQRRDSLAALLWPDADDQRARGALRRTLSVLNSGVGGEWLHIERDEVEVWGPRLELDVRRFKELIAGAAAHGDELGATCARCRRDLRAAASLYAGDFLAGFALRDSPAFDDWQYYEAEGLRRDLAGALDRLVELELAGGAPGAATAHARRRLGIDPLHEPAQRRLMLLYAQVGDRAAAVRQYRECVRVLEDELAVAPLPETTRLYEAIVAGEVVPQLRPGTQPAATRQDRHAAAPPAGERALVGRSAQLEQLLAAHGVEGREGLLLAIEGPPGMGKTRLLGELVTRIQADGMPTLAVACREGEGGIGFGDLLDGLGARVRAAGDWPKGLGIGSRRTLASVFPDLAEDGVAGAAPRPDAGQPLLKALAELISVVLHHPSPGLLAVDDVDAADTATIELLEYLAPRLARLRLHLAVTYRTLETDVAQRIAGMIATAAAHAETLVLRLPALSAGDIEALARSMGVPHVAALGDRLATETDGSPLAVGHYLEAIRLGELRIDDPEWRLPGGARALLRARISALTPVARQVLGAAAVLGDEIEPDMVREVSGRGEDEAVSAIEELVQRGFLREPGGPDVLGAGSGYRFAHRQVQDLALESVSHARARLLHARAATVLRQRQGAAPSRVVDAARIAVHLAAAGRDAEAATFHAEAAAAARRRFAHADAVEHYRAALALGIDDAATIHAAIGDVETTRGRYGAALVAFEHAAAHARVAELPGLEHRLGTLQLRIGAWRMAAQHLAAALNAWPRQDSSGRARVLADLALAEHRSGAPEPAARHTEEAVRVARTSGDAVARAQAHNLRAILARAAGDLARARTELEIALGLASEVGDPSVRVAVLNNAALVEREAGDLLRAVDLTDEALALCVAIGDRHHEAALRNNRADLLHLLGRSKESMEALAESVAIFTEIGEPGRLQPEIWKLVEW